MRKLAEEDAALLATLAAAPAHPWPDWVSADDVPLGNWIAGSVGHHRQRCVSKALAAVRLIAPRLSRAGVGADPAAATSDVVATDARVAERVAAVERWLGDQSEASQSSAIGSFDHTRQTRAWNVPALIDRVDAWIDEAADFAVHTVWSGALPGPPAPPPPHLCAALAAICARRALMNDGVGGRQSTLLVAKAVRAPIALDPQLAAARVEGNMLYLKSDAARPEEAHDWPGPAPASAHYATIEFSDSTHVYTTRYERKISVYDAAGALLGELTEERWE